VCRRGTADNRPAHDQSGGAPAQILASRGRLGNAKLLLEMGEEIGSPGLRQTCERRAGGCPPTC
jgi:hypothetical protein